jgi:uncharacterized protein (DUF1501 family)
VIELDGTRDYVILLLVASALGAIGGFAYELTLGGKGRIELPRKTHRGRYSDLGVWANVLLGAIAAPAALWVFPPEERTSVNAAGEAVTTTEWNIIKVVGLSLIIGSAASSFLTAMQARALALVKTQEAEQTRKVANQQLEAVKSAVQTNASAEQVVAQVETAKVAVQSIAIPGPGNPDFE